MNARSLKVRIYPTKEQEVLINKTLGCCRQVFNISLSSHDSPLSTNIGYLFEIIHLCETHHVQSVIVTMPVMAEYKEVISSGQVALHDSVMSCLPSSAIYIDASDWAIPADGWYNATHLTKEESIEFTEQLMEAISLRYKH